MNFGFIKTATFTPKIKVGDVDFNVKSIKQGIDLAQKAGVHVLVFPELCLTGFTAGDLFFQDTLLNAVNGAVLEIAEYTSEKNLIVFFGAPVKKDGVVYNVCIGVCDGVILGVVPKTYMPNSNAFNQKRYFECANEQLSYVCFGDGDCEDNQIPFGKNIIFADDKIDAFKISVEIGDDLSAVVPPSVNHALNGARLIVNLSATPEFSGQVSERINLVLAHSKKAVCAYVYANAGDGESSTDCVFSGHSLICENGELLAQSTPYKNGLLVSEVDLSCIDFERRKIFNGNSNANQNDYYYVGFSVETENHVSQRVYDKTPFIKQGEQDFLINTSAQGLKKRIEHTNAGKAVLGLSGGLDSTLALIIAVRAVKLLNRPATDVLAITMPCFGTTSRTLENSIKLAKSLGVSLKKIDVTKSVTRHLKDIGHSTDLHDPAYENAQARERTQVLMDVANMCNGLVVGTGDLSELALGWATYNGDHMSMYAVNASIPKTLVKNLVEYTAQNSKGKVKAVLLDILDTPVSPELIPSDDKTIKQVTEDIVGPYILHDFFLYMMIKRGFSPAKIYHVAVNTFKNQFDSKTILKWLKTFVRRFFNQQFKRSCVPDGVKVSEMSLSPRGSFVMPSDALSTLWLQELEQID